MRKQLQLLICMMLIILSAKAQMGGPDTYGYIWRDNTDAQGPLTAWIDIAVLPGAVQVTGLGDDNKVGPFTMPFTFQYYWYQPSSFYIGSNGYIVFSNTALAQPFPLIPTPGGGQDYIAPQACDLTFVDATSNPIPGAECWRWTNAANDTMIISWVNVPLWDPTGFVGANTFEAILTSTDSSITFQYQAQSGIYTNPTDYVSIGIENNSGNIGLQHSHDIFPVAPYAVKFFAPASTTLQINDAATTWCNNPADGALFLSQNGFAYTMTAEVNNSGNQNLASFNVNSVVRAPNNSIQAQSNTLVTNLNVGQTQFMTFPQTFSPIAPAAYRQITTTQLSGDATPTNDAVTLELDVLDTTLTDIILSYDNGTAPATGLSWNGGNGGGANLMYPPFYPCYITKVRAWINANPNLVGMSLQVYDDDGLGGSALTQLDSVYIDGTTVIVGGWNEVTLANPIQVDSGGFYVAWLMDGDGIVVANNLTAPFSHRSFEILGLASNPLNWSPYRNNEAEELMINATITKTLVGVNDIAANENSVGQFYPNPARNYSKLNYFTNGREKVSYGIYDLNGKLIRENTVTYKANGKGSVEVKVNDIDAGIYLCKVQVGSQSFERKLVVIK